MKEMTKPHHVSAVLICLIVVLVIMLRRLDVAKTVSPIERSTRSRSGLLHQSEIPYFVYFTLQRLCLIARLTYSPTMP